MHAFIDSGCLCYGVINSEVADTLLLPRIPILARRIETAEKSTQDKPIVDSITYLSLDLDGHETKKLWLYVLPNSTHKLMLGKKWMEDEDVIIHAKEDALEFRSTGQKVFNIRRWRKELSHGGRPRVNSVETIASYADSVLICRASLEDINKALRNKPRLTTEQARARLPDWVKPFAHMFADDQGAETLPPHRGHLDHAIRLKEENGTPMQPPWGLLYNMSREELLVLRKSLTNLLEKGWIRNSSSASSAPVLFVKKPGGGLRFCVDYRGLNAITIPDRYPLPLFRETLRQLSKARWFTKLDVKSAFHRIRIREGDEPLTAFRCRLGLFEWLVTPFGLSNAPATFQRYINDVLRAHLDLDATAYMDDVLCYNDKSQDEHRATVIAVLENMSKAGLYLDIDKCEFEVKQTRYLGFIIKAGEGVTVDPEKVKTILEWRPPTTVQGVRSFLGFANFYRTFIDNFSDIAAPLTQLTRKRQSWQWGPAENEAFEQLKRIFASEPVLLQWDPERSTVLEADCSGYALGGCLSQYDGQGRLRPVAYYSRKLSPAESNYPIHDKEMLAIVSCLTEWSPELQSVAKPFTVFSDHKNLSYFTTKQLLNERQVRYSEVLSRFNFQLQWRPGKHCERPDALSRRDDDRPHDLTDERMAGRVMQLLPSVSANSATLELVEPDAACLAKLFDDTELQTLWSEGVSADDWTRARDAVKNGQISFPPDIAAKLTANIAECHVDQENVLRGREGRIWVPNYEPLRTALMQTIHDHHLSGHPGRDTMVTMLLRRWFWPRIRDSVRRFLRNCNVCGRTTVWREAKAGFLRSLPIPERIGTELTIDFVTDLPKSHGCTNVMVITDRLAKDVQLFGTATMDAKHCAEIFVDRYYRYHGFPSFLTSNRGSNWLSHFWKAFCRLTQIKQRLTTSYHPQSNASERANQEVYKYLRTFTNYAQNNWFQLLPMAQLALNGRPHSALGGMSPFFLRHGYDVDPIGPPPNSIENRSRHPGNIEADKFVRRLRDAQDFAQATMASTQQRNELNGNRTRRQPERFEVGDKVWLDLKNVSTPQLSKELAWQHAKYTVTAVPDPLTVELNVPGNISKQFHVELVKRAGNDPFPSQKKDDVQNPPLIDDLDSPMYEIDEILRARTARKGRGSRREALVKWTGWADPTWEPVSALRHTDALKQYEDTYGPIAQNDGPAHDQFGMFVGPPEAATREHRRQRRQPFSKRREGGL